MRTRFTRLQALQMGGRSVRVRVPKPVNTPEYLIHCGCTQTGGVVYTAEEEHMKVTTLEGDPTEIAEYMKLTGAATPATTSSKAVGGNDADDELDEVGDDVTPTSEVEVGGGGELDEDDVSWIKSFIWSRGKTPQRTQLVETFVVRALDLEGVMVESGSSTRTANGESNYLMVRDDGLRKFGAVTYVKPHSASLGFRLLAEDVEDVKEQVQLRNIVKGQHQYRVNLALHTQEDVELGLELTKRALAKVRV